MLSLFIIFISVFIRKIRLWLSFLVLSCPGFCTRAFVRALCKGRNSRSIVRCCSHCRFHWLCGHSSSSSARHRHRSAAGILGGTPVITCQLLCRRGGGAVWGGCGLWSCAHLCLCCLPCCCCCLLLLCYRKTTCPGLRGQRHEGM